MIISYDSELYVIIIVQDEGDSHVFFVNSLSKSARRIICEVKIKHFLLSCSSFST